LPGKSRHRGKGRFRKKAGSREFKGQGECSPAVGRQIHKQRRYFPRISALKTWINPVETRQSSRPPTKNPPAAIPVANGDHSARNRRHRQIAKNVYFALVMANMEDDWYGPVNSLQRDSAENCGLGEGPSKKLLKEALASKQSKSFVLGRWPRFILRKSPRSKKETQGIWPYQQSGVLKIEAQSTEVAIYQASACKEKRWDV